MALNITKYNTSSKVVFTNEPTEKVGFKKVVELGELPKVFKLLGVHYFKGGNYGESCFACIALDNGTAINVDLPKGACETIKNVLNDSQAIAEINAGRVGIRFSTYTSKKFNKDNCTAFSFVEISDSIPF